MHRATARAAAALVCLALAATTASAQPAVQRTPGGWLIQPQGRSLAELAQALAASSGSRLDGPPGVLAAASAPLQGPARWAVASLDQAWALLLDGRVSHARQCSGHGAAQRCTLWLVPGQPAHSGPSSLSDNPSAAVPRTMPMADPPGLFPSTPEAGS